MRTFMLFCCAFVLTALEFPAEITPASGKEFGPEALGLRMRLAAHPRDGAPDTGYRVQVELLNVSEKDVTLRANWRDETQEDFRAYFEAAVSIECDPPIPPWIGGVRQGHRQSEQPEQVLKPGESISVMWETDQRRLKNRVSNPNEVQNPTFPFPGLYSVHATMEVITGDGTALLRSNDQLVSVGGSRAMPRPTMAQVRAVDGKSKTATISLGSLHQVATGDQFEIGSPKAMHWRLTITGVSSRWSWGDLELLTISRHPPFSDPPPQNSTAVLVKPK